jgi:hypothetical protein
MSINVNKAKKKRICAACTQHPFLRHEIGMRGEKRQCSYCSRSRKTLRIDDFADYIDVAFKDHYQQTSVEAYPGDEPAGDPVSYMIQEAADIDEPAAEDARAVLEDRYDSQRTKNEVYDENPFSPQAHYRSKGIRITEYLEEWESFRWSLLTEARLFNSYAESVLARVFEGLEKHVTAQGKKVIVNAGSGQGIKALYRARAFQSDEKLEAAIARPDAELGPPPAASAVAGRMNARGIGVFYGATHAEVATAEIRPPVGSRVLVGRFEIIRPLRLLDLDAMRSIRPKGSIFEASFLATLEKTAFLDTMSARITRPVMPDDEASEYLVTQAIADYLATRQEPALDGIVYPSAQQGGKAKRNVVLFHKSARVERIALPKHTQISAHVTERDEDGVRPDYSVFVRKPPQKDEANSPHPFLAALHDPWVRYPGVHPDVRDPALRIDLSSLNVFHVGSVKFSGSNFSVRRHETQMSDRELEKLREQEKQYEF